MLGQYVANIFQSGQQAWMPCFKSKPEMDQIGTDYKFVTGS